jgi:hypothetical protein
MPDLLKALGFGADVLRDALFDEPNLWSFGRLSDTPDLLPLDGEEIPAGERYVTITLHAQRVAYGRKVTTTYYPAVRCFATVKRLLAEPAQFSTITTPTELEAISKQDLGRVIFGEQPLLGPVVYWGPLRVSIALHAIPAADLAAPYLALLTDVSTKVGVGALGAVAPIAESLRLGIYAVTGAGRETMEVGYAVGAMEGRTGYFAVIGRNGIDVSRCRLADRQLHDASGSPIAAPWFVFSVKASTAIPDWWAAVPGLIPTYARAAGVRSVQDLDDIERECRALISASDDLTREDRKRAREHLAARFDERREELKLAEQNEAFRAPLDDDALVAEAIADLRNIRLADPVPSGTDATS